MDRSISDAPRPISVDELEAFDDRHRICDERLPGGMTVSSIGIGASALLTPDLRLGLWAAYAIGWIVGLPMASRPRTGLSPGVVPTESLIERFGLFVIIVLGEVVIGVVDGLSAIEPDALTLLTGLLALVIGFGLWWLYFDLVGRRLPREGRWVMSGWIISHLPITLAITAVGVGVVSLVEHAHDPVTPAGTAWLLASSMALGLLGLIAIARSLADAVRLATVYRPLSVALAIGTAATLLAGWLAPGPWVLALILVVILSALWFFAVAWLIRAGAWGEDSAAQS